LLGHLQMANTADHALQEEVYCLSVTNMMQQIEASRRVARLRLKAWLTSALIHHRSQYRWCRSHIVSNIALRRLILRLAGDLTAMHDGLMRKESLEDDFKSVAIEMKYEHEHQVDNSCSLSVIDARKAVANANEWIREVC